MPFSSRQRLMTVWLAAGLACGPFGCRQGADSSETPSPGEPAAAPAAAPATIMGVVQLDGRTDHSGIQVYIPGTSLISITNAAGEYRLSGIPPSNYEVHARAEGFVTKPIATIQIPYETSAMNYTVATATLAPAAPAAGAGMLASLGSLRGQLTVAGTDLEVSAGVDWTGSIIELRGTPYRTTSAADGSFLFWNIPADNYMVDVHSPGFASLEQESRVLPGPAEQPMFFALNLDTEMVSTPVASTAPTTGPAVVSTPVPATATLSGYAIKNTDLSEDMSGITVALAGTSILAVTDGQGLYRLSNIPAGSYQLMAQAEGYRPASLGPLELAAGESLEAEALYLDPEVDAPYVLATQPSDGARDVTILREIPIDIQFNTRMNPASVGQSIRIEPAVAFSVVAGNALPERDYNRVRVIVFGALQQPVAQFKTRYTLTIDTGAVDDEGTPLEQPFQMSFTTASPGVVGTYPPDGAQGVPLTPQQRLQIFFNAEMDGETLRAEVLRISPKLSAEPNVSIVPDPQTGWTRLDVQANWEPDTNYRVTIQRRARTLGKNSLYNTPYTIRFRTARGIVPNTSQNIRNQPGQ